MTTRVGRIPYVNCYPVYGAIDRGIVPLDADLVSGVPTALNALMATGELDVSVVSATEYARSADGYLLLPDLAISCNGPVRSVMLFSKRRAEDLGGHRVLVSRSSMTSVGLLELLFENVFRATPSFVPGAAEVADLGGLLSHPHEARLVIGDAALLLSARMSGGADGRIEAYPFAYDLGDEWLRWTGLPFVFAVWVARRVAPVARMLAVHARLIESRDWGVTHLPLLARQAAEATGVAETRCLEYFSGLDYRLSYRHLAGLTEFFRRLVSTGRVPDGSLAFLPAA
ncbi:MAG: menaquinone biosynthesis protein [Gemmatimonadaceae bacterium]